MKKLLMVFGAASLTAALAGCGGGNDATPAPPPGVTEAVPSSAMTSVDGLISYLKLLIASSADTLSPIDVSNVTLPTDDTASPTPLN